MATFAASGEYNEMNDVRERAMNRALELAETAAMAGDTPVGAVVVDSRGEVVGEGFNRRDAAKDPFAHAEVEAVRQAAAKLGTWNLAECTLVVTLEPCPMCAGAAVMSHVGRIVFGAWDEKMGACGSVWDIPRDPHVGFMPEVIGGVDESRCVALLREFFSSKR
jgi:tRNA(adenine34) deaminase